MKNLKILPAFAGAESKLVNQVFPSDLIQFSGGW